MPDKMVVVVAAPAAELTFNAPLQRTGDDVICLELY